MAHPAAALVTLGLLCSSLASPATASDGPPLQGPGCSVQVVGFGGGHVLPEWIVFSNFQRIARSIRDLHRPDICVRTFPGALAPLALGWIRRGFPPRGRMSPAGTESGPVVIIYGYSSGGWSALSLARQLGREQIPVELVVQIDAPWFGRSKASPNIRFVANFYEHRTWLPLLWGTSRVQMDEPDRTTLVMNRRPARVGHFRMPALPDITSLIVETALRAAASPR
jgi:hypothetical protein